MKSELSPVIGNWYRHLDKGQMFLVVSFDRQDGVIRLQHFDGDLEEVDIGSWSDMDLESAAAPEDWTGPVDEVERDDLAYSETEMSDADWRRPTEETPGAAAEAWEDTRSENELDEWAEGGPTEEAWEPHRVEGAVAGPPPDEEAAAEGEESESGS